MDMPHNSKMVFKMNGADMRAMYIPRHPHTVPIWIERLLMGPMVTHRMEAMGTLSSNRRRRHSRRRCSRRTSSTSSNRRRLPSDTISNNGIKLNR